MKLTFAKKENGSFYWDVAGAGSISQVRIPESVQYGHAFYVHFGRDHRDTIAVWIGGPVADGAKTEEIEASILSSRIYQEVGMNTAPIAPPKPNPKPSLEQPLMTVKQKHPIQPIEEKNGVYRFKKNEIVSRLLDWATDHGMGMNEIARMNVSREDRQQFAQLIGYSLSAYGDLSYVDDDAYQCAVTMVEEGIDPKDARIAYLEQKLFMIRASLQDPVAKLFGIHPDDLGVPTED